MIAPINQNRDSHLRASFQKTWGYVRHELLYVLWAIMEAALITPIALSFMPWASAWPSGLVAFWLTLLALIPLNLARFMTYLRIPLSWQRVVMNVSVFLIILIAIRTLIYDLTSIFDLSWIAEFLRNISETDNALWQRDVSVFVLVGFTWWRGLLLVTREPDIVRLGSRIRSGALYIAPFAILAAYVNLKWSIVPYLLLFFAVGLTAVSLTRTEQIEREQQAQVTSMTFRWFITVALVSIFVVVLAGFLAFSVEGTSFSEVGWLMLFWLPIRFGGSVVAMTIVYLSTPFLNVLEAFWQWVIVFWRTAYLHLFTTAPAAEESDFRPPPNEWLIKQLSKPTGEALLNWRMVLLVCLVVLVILTVFALGRMYQRQRLVTGSHRFSRSIGGEVTDLAAREKAGWGQQILQRLGLLRHLRTAASIRRIYYQMEQAAAAAGYPRDESVTPYEYLPSLQQVWPENTADSQHITDAFVRIRYGEYPETDEEFIAIKQAWRRLELTRPQESV